MSLPSLPRQCHREHARRQALHFQNAPRGIYQQSIPGNQDASQQISGLVVQPSGCRDHPAEGHQQDTHQSPHIKTTANRKWHSTTQESNTCLGPHHSQQKVRGTSKCSVMFILHHRPVPRSGLRSRRLCRSCPWSVISQLQGPLA